MTSAVCCTGAADTLYCSALSLEAGPPFIRPAPCTASKQCGRGNEQGYLCSENKRRCRHVRSCGIFSLLMLGHSRLREHSGQPQGRQLVRECTMASQECPQEWHFHHACPCITSQQQPFHWE